MSQDKSYWGSIDPPKLPAPTPLHIELSCCFFSIHLFFTRMLEKTFCLVTGIFTKTNETFSHKTNESFLSVVIFFVSFFAVRQRSLNNLFCRQFTLKNFLRILFLFFSIHPTVTQNVSKMGLILDNVFIAPPQPVYALWVAIP
jgi:hypothetical protein